MARASPFSNTLPLRFRDRVGFFSYLYGTHGRHGIKADINCEYYYNRQSVIRHPQKAKRMRKDRK